jgi:alpha-aminoadipic semialdehyde synthase
LAILNCLPITLIEDPDDLQKLMDTKDDPKHLSTIYVTVFTHQHLVKKKTEFCNSDDGKGFDKLDYYANPEKYERIFHSKYLRYVSVFFHCMYWEPKFPIVFDGKDMKNL